MFVAKNHQGELCNLLDGIPERQAFECPACQEPVILRNGSIMRPHFAHVSLKTCHFFHENESEEHLALKAELFSNLSQRHIVEIEKFLPGLGQIADLWVGEKLVLEVQCSRLSEQRLLERTKAYQNAGYHVRWLLGEKLWLGKRLTSLQKQFLYFSSNMGFHYWELDVRKRQLRLKYLIYEDWEGKLSYLEKSCSFDQDILTFLRSPYASQTMPFYQKPQNQQLLQTIQSGLISRNPRWMLLQEQAYVSGGNLLSRSLDDFYPQVRPPESKQGFCQIREDLSHFRTAFFHYYKRQANKNMQVLYPPVFYEKALDKYRKSATIKEKGVLL